MTMTKQQLLYYLLSNQFFKIKMNNAFKSYILTRKLVGF